MFAFCILQSYGAGGFALAAVAQGKIWLYVAVLPAAVGKMLVESGILLEAVTEILEHVWGSWNTKADKSPESNLWILEHAWDTIVDGISEITIGKKLEHVWNVMVYKTSESAIEIKLRTQLEWLTKSPLPERSDELLCGTLLTNPQNVRAAR